MQEQPQFKSGVWEVELNVRDFVSQNVTPYDGDSSFLSGPTEKTKRVWEHCLQALKEERENPHGVRSARFLVLRRMLQAILIRITKLSSVCRLTRSFVVP